jgi:hypothetical protein
MSSCYVVYFSVDQLLLVLLLDNDDFHFLDCIKEDFFDSAACGFRSVSSIRVPVLKLVAVLLISLPSSLDDLTSSK